MRILVLNYEYPPIGSGAGIVTEHLVHYFSREHQVTVLTSWFKGLEERTQIGSIEIIRLRSRRNKIYQSNPLEMFDWSRKAREFLGKHPEMQFDFCLSNFTMPGGIVALWLKKERGVPYNILSHGHDIPWMYPKQMFFWHILTYPRIRKILLESEYNILLSEEMKENADKLLPVGKRTRNVVVPNGVNIEKFRISHPPKEMMNLLFAARLVEQKDPMSLLAGVRELKESGVPFRLDILGDGPMRDKMEKYILDAELDGVYIHGKVSRVSVMHFLDKADVLVAPSLNEAMSLSILEALSRGVLVVATRVSGNKEIILEGVNGYWVERQSPLSISQVLQRVFREKVEPGFRFPANYMDELHKFDWAHIAQRHLDLMT